MSSILYPATRREARALGFSRYDTGKACRAGHLGPRYAATGGCIECHAVLNREAADRRRQFADPILSARAKARGDHFAKAREARRAQREAADRAIRTAE